jgi:predicted RNA-binding protein with PUA-like domain
LSEAKSVNIRGADAIGPAMLDPPYRRSRTMAYWLVKSEPAKYSWDQMVADGRTHWDGVRNFQAANNLRAMKVGDRAFFYHSNDGKEIVGIVEIVRPFYSDPGDPGGKFGMVDVAPVMPVKIPVTLAAMKAVPDLAGMALLRQSRLSVCPVSEAEWRVVCRMAGIGE